MAAVSYVGRAPRAGVALRLIVEVDYCNFSMGLGAVR